MAFEFSSAILRELLHRHKIDLSNYIIIALEVQKITFVGALYNNFKLSFKVRKEGR